MAADTNSHFIVRLATKQDLESLVAFNVALAWETEKKQLDRLRLKTGVEAVLHHTAHGFYIVVEDPKSGRVIGQMLITFEWSDWRNAVFWWVQSVYVDKDWRKQGVFRKLYQYVMNESRSREHVAGIRLYVERDNHVAQKVYERLGLATAPYHVFEKDYILASEETS